MTDSKAGAGTGRLRKRRLLLWSALPVMLVLCVAAKLLSLGPIAEHAARAFAANDAAAVGIASEGLQLGNILERHKAPFAAGDALVLSGDTAAARSKFEEALDLAPANSADACIIRLNLVLAIERLGDGKLRSQDPAAAAITFTEALDMAAAAPDGCFPAGAGAEAGGKFTQAEERLRDKLEGAGAGAGQEERQQEPGEEEQQADAPNETQLEELAESARESQRERNNGREREEYLGDSEYAPGPDRPW
ncbi:hypothetical protein [Arthrobacter sp. ZGTC412]|uniref:hypothetical protein n=1 Tax=Arthrobacter sp. ZGTC412 TaxID=2058900 RepID=UPI002157C949|nr:hypothetical protein [Arthrobacter sp. ZGTC412]